MNISIVQPQLSVAKRANNLSNLGTMIRHEAKRSVAPDLIVLPDCCVATQETDSQSQVTMAMCQGFAEAFAWWAREWGVWIAVGHSILSENGLEEVATLFDPDGDPFIRAKDPSTESKNTENAWVVRNSPIGRVALCSWNASARKACPPIEWKRSPDLIIVPAVSPNRAAIKAIANDHDAYAASAGCILAETSDNAQSFVADPNGKVIAEAPPDQVYSTLVSVDINPCNEPDDWEATEVIE
ncbi:MAG: hypothetical protein DHS20C16_12220 [Phycisphaerae bacterium]|nr:MAG: hypothetical protein DHS20C16_12220 [Phycisphaerae bacterium]